jgi:hypothetical protein
MTGRGRSSPPGEVNGDERGAEMLLSLSKLAPCVDNNMNNMNNISE